MDISIRFDMCKPSAEPVCITEPDDNNPVFSEMLRLVL